jgi:hypothetical protein
MQTLPRQDPSDGNSAETRGESQKFQSPTCGVELLAGRITPSLDLAVIRREARDP